jgi:hypothetical protein
MKNNLYKIRKDTDYETEPDYAVRLICIVCGSKETLSGEYCDFYEIDNTNFKCQECK